MEEDEIQPDYVAQTTKLLNEINASIVEAKESIDKIAEKTFNTSRGISLLDVKCHTLMSYLGDLAHVILKKCKFESINGDPSIERLVEQRTVLKCIRPLEFKIKYQIDKLVKTALSGDVDPNNPDRFRATIDGLADVDDNEEDEQSDADETGRHNSKKAKDGLYVAPKVTAVPYDGDESQAIKKQKELERAKKRALQSSVMQELREEYADTPVEVQINTVGLKNKQSKYDYERQKYEEDYFTRYIFKYLIKIIKNIYFLNYLNTFFSRLPVTKKDKHRAKQLASVTLGKLGKEITHFEDISALAGKYSEKSGNKRKKKFKGKNLKKKKKF